jgi:hypothetical protein
MLDRLRGRLTYANVMASIAVFFALGGSSYAAVMLADNSVKSRHIAPGAVHRSDVRHPAWRTASLTPSGAWVPHGDPYAPPGFYKDVTGTVHLRGVATSTQNQGGCFLTGPPIVIRGAGVVFVLPPGFRPPHQAEFPASFAGDPGQVTVLKSGAVCRSGDTASGESASFDGITFRAEG